MNSLLFSIYFSQRIAYNLSMLFHLKNTFLTLRFALRVLSGICLALVIFFLYRRLFILYDPCKTFFFQSLYQTKTLEVLITEILTKISVTGLLLIAGVNLSLILQKCLKQRFPFWGLSALGFLIYGELLFITGSLFIFSFEEWRLLSLSPLLLTPLFYKDWLIWILKAKVSFMKSPFKILFLMIPVLGLLLLCNTPPVDYDELEYHLGAPEEYIKNGSISFLPHNVYANMPSLSSMLNLSLLSLDSGDAAKTLQLLFLILSVLCLIQPAYKKLWFLPILLFFSFPENVLTSFTARNEPMIGFYGICAFRSFFSLSPYRFIGAGLFLGCAVCLKFSSAVLFLPFFLLMFWKYSKSSQRIKQFIQFTFSFFIPLLPWGIRNALVSHNPFYPFFNTGFTLHAPSALFEKIHFAPSLSLHDFFSQFFSLGNAYDSNSLWLIVLLLLIAFMSIKSFRIPLLYLLTAILAWYLLTHHVKRFLYPFLIIQSYLVLKTLKIHSLLPSVILRFSIVLQLMANFLFLFYYLNYTPALALNLGQIHKTAFIEKYNPGFTFLRSIKNLSSKSKILFIGEARTYGYSFTVVYNTPFSRPVFEKYFTPELSLKALNKDGIDYIFFNHNELDRVRNKFPDSVKFSNEQLLQEIKNKCSLTASSEKEKLYLFEIPPVPLNLNGSGGK